MKTMVLDKALSFQCIAGACTATCCAGWSILIDEKDYRRFEKLEPVWLRDDILTNVQKRGEQYFFKNDVQGRCAMLDEDGLCRIQRNTSEEVLCNTCRKYPRLINSMGGMLYLSMAVSCPVIAEYLVQESVNWLLLDDSGRSKLLTMEEMDFVSNSWSLYQTGLCAAAQLQEELGQTDVLYSCFEKMADGVLEIILQYQEQSLPVTLFHVFENDISEKVADFLRVTQKAWKGLAENYMKYRIVSRKIEFPGEAKEQCIRQALGELFLLRTLAFCYYVGEGNITLKDMAELLQKMYRFAAHGKKVSKAFKDLLGSFFSQDILWCYLML